jgi:hypothetical protein
MKPRFIKTTFFLKGRIHGEICQIGEEALSKVLRIFNVVLSYITDHKPRLRNTIWLQSAFLSTPTNLI